MANDCKVLAPADLSLEMPASNQPTPQSPPMRSHLRIEADGVWALYPCKEGKTAGIKAIQKALRERSSAASRTHRPICKIDSQCFYDGVSGSDAMVNGYLSCPTLKSGSGSADTSMTTQERRPQLNPACVRRQRVEALRLALSKRSMRNGRVCNEQ